MNMSITALLFCTASAIATGALADEPWAGSFLATEPGVKGLPEQMFAG